MRNSDLELSRPLRIEKISANGVKEKIIASPSERTALAERFSLPSIEKLEADLTVMPADAGRAFAVKGEVVADVTQNCVVTLEPIKASIKHPVAMFFTTEATTSSDEAGRTLDEDDVEPITNGIIDLGEVAAQHFGIALDPYPRKEGVAPIEAQFSQPEIKANPFARLKLIKDQE